MKRRTFIRNLGGTVAATGLSSSFGFGMPGAKTIQQLLNIALDSDKVLVLVYLEGGNDGLNTVIPLDQLSALNTVRPHVMLPDSSLINLPQTNVALHPSLTGFSKLYNQGHLGIVQSVGYENQSYSHFRSTDIWMSASDSNQQVNTGWSGRLLNKEYPAFPVNFPNDTMPDPLAIEMGSGSSLLFQGPTASMSMSISDETAFHNLINDVEEPAPNTPAGEQLKYIRLVARQSQEYGAVVKTAAEKVTQQASFPDTGLATQLKIVSRLIAGGLQTPIYLVRLGGFDTHSNQVVASDHTTGGHADLLKELDDAVMAFMTDLEQQGTGDKVMGLTFSEFGRRIVSNASQGTDHGAAQPMFFFGNKVKGGVIGNNPIISTAATYEDNLPMQYDFRQVYASAMQQWLGASSATSSDMLFKEFETLALIGASDITGIDEPLQENGIKVYPNPINGHTTITYLSSGEKVSINLFDIQGRKQAALFSGVKPRGKQLVNWNSNDISPGKYIVVIESAAGKQVASVIKN